MVEFRKAIKKDLRAAAGTEHLPPGEGVEFNFSGRVPLVRRTPADRSAQDLYLEGLALAAAMIEWASGYGGDFPLMKTLEALIRDTCDWIATDQAWRLLTLCRASSEPSYLPAHSMNVCIIAAYLAFNTGMRDDQVSTFATVAFLHDIGMANLKDILENANKLNQDQLEEVKNHPLESLKLIDSIGCCDDPGVALMAVEHHERIDGSGYPNKKAGSDISSAAHILMVADIFSAMTHGRKYREAVIPFEAVRTITHLAGRQLQSDIVRRFLQLMSIYPLGSGVRLNNGVVARVISSNEKQLTKPVVQIITPAGEFCERDQIIDLHNEKLLFIREPVSLGALDPSFNIG
jgi:HD-GYP domain-containing protein (c-di-GMP phosphodiesterase class II)